MTDTPDKPDIPNRTGPNWTGKAAIAGAAIGSAAIAAALLYASRRRDRKKAPIHPEDAPETD
jgi:hypothetical protein